MLAPCTVIDADTSDAWFVPRITLTSSISYEKVWLRVDFVRSVVMLVAGLDAWPPSATRHFTHVSDTHSVASHPVYPFRTLLVYALGGYDQNVPDRYLDGFTVLIVFARLLALTACDAQSLTLQFSHNNF